MVAELLSPMETIRRRLSLSRSRENLAVSDQTLGAINTSCDLSPCTPSEKTGLVVELPPLSQTIPKKSKKKDKAVLKKKHCTARCKYQGKEALSAMVQCFACQVWFHYQCIGEKESEIVGIWSCQSCRTVAKTVNALAEKVTSLENTLRMLQENNTQLSRIIVEQNSAAEKMQEENRILRGEVTELRTQMRAEVKFDTVISQLDHIIAQLTQRHDTKPPEDMDLSATKKTLVLSDGLLGDYSPLSTSDGRPAQLQLQQGATPRDMASNLNDKRLSPDVQDIIVVCGQPRISVPLDTYKQELGSLLNSVAATGKPATVSSIPPMSVAGMPKIAEMNSVAATECERLGVKFVDHDTNFVFRDGTRDESCFMKNESKLSASGTQRLLSNLSLCSNTVDRADAHPVRRNASHSNRARRPTTPNVTNSATRSQQHTGYKPYRPTSGQCSKCGEDNHVTKRCRHKGKVTCHTCKGEGHKSKHHT